MTGKKGSRGKGRTKELILLKDLVPRKDPKGGAGQSVFGERSSMPGVPGAESSDPSVKGTGKKRK